VLQNRTCVSLLNSLSTLRDVETRHSFPDLDYTPSNRDHTSHKNPKRNQNKRKIGNELVPLKSTGSKWSPYNDARYPNPVTPFAFIDFRRLEDPVRVLEALDRSRDFLQMRQIVAALTRLRVLGHSITRKMLFYVMELATDRVESSRMEDCIGMFLLASRLRLLDHPKLLNGLAKLSMERRYPSQMSIRELATLIHSCGFLIRLQDKRKLQFKIGDDLEDIRPSGYEVDRVHELIQVEELMDMALEEFAIFRELDCEFELRLPSVITSIAHFGSNDTRLMELLKRVVQSLTRVDENRIVSIVFAIANSRIQRDELIERLAMEITKPERLMMFQTNQLIGLVSAFSKLRFENYGMWYSIFLELSQKLRVQELKVHQIELILRSMISTRMTDSVELVTSIIQGSLTQEKIDNVDSHQLKELLILISYFPDLKSIDGRRFLNKFEMDLNLEEIRDEDFVLMIKGCAKLRIDQSSKISFLVSEAGRNSRYSQMDVNGMIIILHSFTRMNWNESKMLQPLLKHCFSPNQITRIRSEYHLLLVEVIGKLKFNPSTSLRFLLTKIKQSEDCYSVHRMISCLFHLSQIPGVKIEDSELIIDEFFRRSGRLALKPSDAGMLVRALGDLRIYHPGIMDQIQRCIQLQHEAFSQRDIMNCLIGFTKLLYRETRVFKLLLTQARHVIGFGGFGACDLVVIIRCLSGSELELSEFEELVQEVTSWSRMRELEMHQLVELVFCMERVDGIVQIKDRTSIDRLCDYIEQDQILTLLSEEQLKELDLCFDRWKIEHSLVNKIRSLANRNKTFNSDFRIQTNRQPLVVMDSKDMTASWVERLLDGR